jgi:hypothetical protein
VTGELGWLKSTFSAANGACLEATRWGELILVRDSKYRRRPGNDPLREPLISLPVQQWDAFRDDVAAGRSPDGDALQLIAAPDGSVDLVATGDGTTLSFRADEWLAFVAGAEHGDLDSHALALAGRR